jgi:hypothetical protein
MPYKFEYQNVGRKRVSLPEYVTKIVNLACALKLAENKFQEQ